MHRILLFTTAFVLCGAARGAWARPDEASPTGAAQPSAAQATTDAPTAASPQTNSSGDAWRFKRHQDLWWYWQPTEKWVYWTGDAWQDYDPATFAQFQASRRGRSYSSSGKRETGPWGPVRYNGYGQVEYPYSRRTRGIKQLGPVPAMGGVRSLPGWGGER